MISIGKNIKQPNDPLEKISLKMLYDKTRNPQTKFIDFIEQLRKLRTIDEKQYRQYKTRLPYVVAANFNPSYRKIENFAKAKYFILDFDHFSEKEISIDNIFNKLKNDERVNLMFRSPSNDGLKLIFKLSEAFTDHGKYSMFYKIFAHKFGSEYNLSQVVDKRTSDVSRACFVSYDKEAYYNANCSEIDVKHYINFEDELQVFELNKMIKEEEKTLSENITKQNNTDDLPDDLISQIREKLNPKLKEKKEKNIIVPDQLNTIIDLVKTNLLEYNIEIENIIDINYGKQFRMKAKHLKAEVNVFYGKRGFSVVKSTKTGLNKDLVEIAAQIINSCIL